MRDWCNSGVGLVCVVALLLFLLGRAAELKGDEPRVPQTTEELEHAISAVLRETQTPGAGVALVSKDEVFWTTGIELDDRDAGREITPQTMFRARASPKASLPWRC